MTMRHVLGGAAALAIAAVPSLALAGPCTTQINELSQALQADAGSGSRAANAEASGNPAVRATPSTKAPAGATPGTEGTAAMNSAVGGRAASPADVRTQAEGGSTAADTARDPTETGSVGANSGSLASARAALEQARTFDQQGKEAECMAAVADAKRASGM